MIYTRKDGGCRTKVLAVIDGVGLWVEARWTDDNGPRTNRTVLPLWYFTERYGVPAHAIEVGA